MVIRRQNLGLRELVQELRQDLQQERVVVLLDSVRLLREFP